LNLEIVLTLRCCILSLSLFLRIGVYPVEVAAVPGSSDGKWSYVEPNPDGSVVFPPTLLPTSEGVYEARYFRSNGYQVVASHPFILSEPSAEASPSPSPMREGSPEPELRGASSDTTTED
jgi:hypothetical protein